MVPKLTPGGPSFDGAAAYYLADKAAPGGTRPLTAQRVAWTATRNLFTDDPLQACRIMAATAECQLALKTAAGGKATGRKLEKPVLAYSLAWHPSERPSREEQLEAAIESLAALGLEGHQAVIVAHNDEPQAHVHLIVNRVDPATGKAATLSKSRLALSRWAQAYEERRGQVLCAERVENNARRAGTRPGRAAANRSRPVARPEYRAGGSARPEAALLRAQHALRYSVQAGQERQGEMRRAIEAGRFHAGRRAGRKAAGDRFRHQAELAAHPDQADAAVRTAALLLGDRPAEALAMLTRDRSTFSRTQLERFVGRHTPDAASFAAVMATLDASPELVEAGRDARGRVRLTTAAHRALEQRMVEMAATLARSPQGKADVPARFTGWTLSADQQEALQHVLTGNRLGCVSGVAGTGKSTMLDAARQSWEAAGLRVQGVALAAEAAHALQSGSGIRTAGTIHSRLYLWEQGSSLPGPSDVIVVDEAGMVGSRLMERLVHFAQRTGAKLVLVGDAQQLQAIEAGGAFRVIAGRVGDVAIRTVRRQKAAWQQLATGELAAGRVKDALTRYEAAGMVHGHATADAAKAALIAAWHAERRAHPGRSQILMAFLRRDVAALNALARACLRADGVLGPETILPTANGPLPFAIGDRLAFGRNDSRLRVRNGSLSTVTALDDRSLTVRLDGKPGRVVTVDLATYGHVAHGYAATIHKSQGATVDRAHLYCSPNLDCHAAYVAMTRHRDRLDLHWARDAIPDRARLAAILSRTNLKDTSLDYGADRAREDAARQEAAEAMRERVRRRAAGFAAREQSRDGRLANARSLLPAGASPWRIARLALDMAERARLFRQRQSILLQWARRMAVSTDRPAAPAIARPDAAARRAAILAHDAETMRLLAEMDTRHAAQRTAERASRAALRREAAANWHGLAMQGIATASFKVPGYAVEHWQAVFAAGCNDNTARPQPMAGEAASGPGRARPIPA